MVRAPCRWQRTAAGAAHPTTEYRRAAALTQRGDEPPKTGGFFHTRKRNQTIFTAAQRQKERYFMAFFTSAVGVLQTLVIALGAGLGIWGVINLMEGYGNDNPGANAHVR